jgi:hypothetical protein
VTCRRGSTSVLIYTYGTKYQKTASQQNTIMSPKQNWRIICTVLFFMQN